MITPDYILKYCLDTLDGVVEVNSWGELGIFYNPGRILKRGVYVLTVKEKDGENDKASKLDRESVFRLNLGVRKKRSATCSDNCPYNQQKEKQLTCHMISQR